MPQLGLPSPRRTVTKGVSLARRLGLDEDQALHLIVAACQAAIGHARELGESHPWWLMEVQAEAACRHALHRPKGSPDA